MNFKRNLVSIIAFVGSVFGLSGCTDPDAFHEFEFLDPEKDLHQVEDKHEDEDHGTYIKYGDYASYPAKDTNGKTVELGSTYEVLTNYSGQHILSAEGEQKILVIPVEFEDYTIEVLGVEKEEYITNLKKAFFGDYKNNRYASVAEYYNRSSYGKLRLSGMVCDEFYTFPYTTQYIIEKDLASKDVLGCYDDVVKKWLPKTYPSLNLDDYRLENGEIAIYLIYTYPTELKNNTKVFWNFTFPDKPFSWSSYSCLNTLSGAPDAHTLIHETGHLLGLPDYYPTVENDPDPTGRTDMMDCSVGDHTGLSKMMYNWARPYHVKDSCEITINALVNYGDLILINDDWNQTVFDEYYLLEFYSPSGLNNYDANIGNNKAKLPLLPGLKIYHVDARLGYFGYTSEQSIRDNKVFLDYCDVGVADPSTKQKNIALAHNNNASASESGRNLFNLYELQLNNATSIQDQCATDYNLFHKGESFEIIDSKFNSKDNESNYKVTVTSLNYANVTVKIEKLETTQN